MPLIAWFTTIVLLGAPRLIYRSVKEGALGLTLVRQRPSGRAENILIIGSVSEADRVIRSFDLEGSKKYHVAGIVCFNR